MWRRWAIIFSPLTNNYSYSLILYSYSLCAFIKIVYDSLPSLCWFFLCDFLPTFVNFNYTVLVCFFYFLLYYSYLLWTTNASYRFFSFLLILHHFCSYNSLWYFSTLTYDIRLIFQFSLRTIAGIVRYAQLVPSGFFVFWVILSRFFVIIVPNAAFYRK